VVAAAGQIQPRLLVVAVLAVVLAQLTAAQTNLPAQEFLGKEMLVEPTTLVVGIQTSLPGVVAVREQLG
jgi:hypothetical protein